MIIHFTGGMMAKFSVITASLNNKEELMYTYTSVKEQTEGDFEYIVIDGESSDGTVEMLETLRKQDRRVKYVSEKDSGIYNALNKGSLMARGTYTLFMGAGDVFSHKNILREIWEYRGIDVIYGYAIFSSGPYQGQRIGCKLTLKSIFSDCVVAHQAVYMKTEILQKYLFDERFSVQADQDLLIRVYKDKYRFRFINKALCFYDGCGFSSNKDVLERTKMDRIRILKKNYPGLFAIRNFGHLILTGKKFKI